MKYKLYLKKSLIPLKYIIILLLVIFIITNNFILIKLSKQFSKKKLSNVIITGPFDSLNQKEIRNFIFSLKKSYNYFSPYETDIKNKLEAFYFVKVVTIKKQWPDKILIHIINTTPIAYWNDKYILNENKTLSNTLKKKSNISKILYFYGPESNKEEILSNYNTVKNILQENNIILKSISITPQHTWKLIIKKNIVIILGKINNISQLKQLTYIWKILENEEKVKRKKIKRIDLRYKSGIAIEWK
ncbi:MAG: cell division protein FtsQ/DivIB [Buchnera aphidicola (Floraphis meitanensis)]